MAITFTSSSESFTANNASPISVPRPNGAATGDVLVAVAAASTNGTVLSAPSGWTLIESRSDWWPRRTATSLIAIRVIASIGSEPSSYDFTKNQSAFSGAAIVCYRGVDTALPLAVVATSSVAVPYGSITWEIPGVTTLADGSMLVALAVAGEQHQLSISGWSNRINASGTGNPFVSDSIHATAGATGTINMVDGNWAGSAGAAYLTALRPASGDPPGPTRRFWSFAQIVE